MRARCWTREIPATCWAARGSEGRAGGYGTVAAFPGGQVAVVEQTAERAELVAGATEHTNHYLHPDLAALAAPGQCHQLEPAASTSGDCAQALPDEPEPDDLMRLLGSHDAAPEAVCAHGPDPADPDSTIILYAFVADVERRRLWVCEGPPCSGTFEEIDLRDLG